MLNPTPAQQTDLRPIGRFRVSHLRWPSERRTFWFTVLLMVVALFLFTTFSWGMLAVIAGGSVLLAWVITRIRHGALIGGAVKVSAHHTPHLAQLFEECAWRIRPPRVQGFVSQSPTLNAYTFGLTAPHTIVLY